MKRRRLSLSLVLAPLLAWATPASAHAVLVRSMPAAGSAVHGSPATVQLWFSERLEGAFSTVEVVDATGKRVDRHDPKVDAADPRLLQVALTGLPAGTYRVTWRVVSVDTHVSKGEYRFDVAP